MKEKAAEMEPGGKDYPIKIQKIITKNTVKSIYNMVYYYIDRFVAVTIEIHWIEIRAIEVQQWSIILE
ncbi:MAG: hypothetical protein RSA20_07945 [Oscillospiraceae bacterium]